MMTPQMARLYPILATANSRSSGELDWNLEQAWLEVVLADYYTNLENASADLDFEPLDNYKTGPLTTDQTR